MALLVLFGALFWVQRVVFKFSDFIPVVVWLFLFCWVLGPSCPLCWSGFCSWKRELGLGVELSF